MKKLFNYALLAAALLVGVNVNAETNAEKLKAGLEAGGTYQLPEGGDVDYVIENGITLSLTNPAILDLNGHNLVMNDNATDLSTNGTMIILTKGSLTVKNDKKATGGAVKNVQTQKTGKPYYNQGTKYIQVFSVRGSANPTDANYTVLTIDPEITVDAVVGKIGIIVDGIEGKYPDGSDGFKYVSFGVVVNVAGKVHGEKYGIQVSGNVKPNPIDKWKEQNYAEGTAYPIVNVKSTAEVWSNPTATSNGNGMYIGGYAVVSIEGYVHGSNGVYVKSGNVTIKDAVIKSDNPNYTEINGKGSGTEGSGNAIVIESNKSYSGATDIVIKGDSKVEAVSGYAIQEVITNTPDGDTKVEGIKIEGGTFTGGNKGSITIAQKTSDDGAANIIAGSFNDDKANQYLKEGNVRTEIKDENGTTIGTMITTDENAPKDEQKAAVTNKDLNQYIDKQLSEVPDYMYWTTMAGADEPDPVVVTSGKTLILKNFTADWGSITVKDGGTLIVDNPTDADKDAKMLLMGTAVVTLEPGAKMISYSTLGIETASAANLIIGAQVTATESKMAQFLYHPDVNQGRHPKATVEYQAKAKGLTTWDRFGFPDYKGMCINDIKFKGPQAASLIYEWKNDINDWKVINDHNKDIAPFTGLTLTNNSTDGGIIYQFPCEVLGNINGNLDLVDGWNSFSNSYTAKADINAYLQAIYNDYKENISASIYIYDNGQEETGWDVVSFYDLKDKPEKAALAKLDPMQAFLIQKYSTKTVQGSINYKEQVWDPAMPAAPAAPRAIAMDLNKVVITIADAQGKNAHLTLREAAEFSAGFDNGADVALYENANRFNFYTTTDFDNQVQIATDNIEGQVLTLATKGETSYTMTFSDVLGEKMALRDNLTGDVIEMTEGNVYNFMANANEVSERFTVIAAPQAPTALKNAAAKAKAAKFVNKGQVVLQNNGRMFNVLGTELK